MDGRSKAEAWSVLGIRKRAVGLKKSIYDASILLPSLFYTSSVELYGCSDKSQDCDIQLCVCVCVRAQQQIRIAAAPNSHCQYLQTMPSQNLSPACQYMGELKAAIFESLQEFGNSSIVLAKRTPPGAF